MLRMRRKIRNIKFMIQNIGSKLFIIHFSFFIAAEQATLPPLRLISSNTSDFYSREEFSEFLYRNSLIIAEGEDIRGELSNRCEDIYLTSEDDICLWEWFLNISEPLSLRMNGVSSLAREYSMISSDHDGHSMGIFLSFSEIIFVSRMEYIECTETHHMVKLLFWECHIRNYALIFGFKMRHIGEWHIIYQRQIMKKMRLWIQKVNNFRKSFDNI